MQSPRLPRYRLGARVYDVVSMERLVYRAGRRAAVAGLRLRPGDRVLDVGCGTGLNFALLIDALGSEGEVVAVDRSPAMLRQARRRLDRNGWPQISIRHGDAARLTDVVQGRFDAVLFTYSLAIIEDWHRAWSQAVALLRPGGRVAVVDTALPSGRWRFLARVALFTGGVDPSRVVWQCVLHSSTNTEHHVLKGGHVHVAVGTR